VDRLPQRVRQPLRLSSFHEQKPRPTRLRQRSRTPTSISSPPTCSTSTASSSAGNRSFGWSSLRRICLPRSLVVKESIVTPGIEGALTPYNLHRRQRIMARAPCGFASPFFCVKPSSCTRRSMTPL
jgi:hypothetical protein